MWKHLFFLQHVIFQRQQGNGIDVLCFQFFSSPSSEQAYIGCKQTLFSL